MEKTTFLRHQSWYSFRGSTYLISLRYLVLIVLILNVTRAVGQGANVNYQQNISATEGLIINPTYPTVTDEFLQATPVVDYIAFEKMAVGANGNIFVAKVNTNVTSVTIVKISPTGAQTQINFSNQGHVSHLLVDSFDDNIVYAVSNGKLYKINFSTGNFETIFQSSYIEGITIDLQGSVYVLATTSYTIPGTSTVLYSSVTKIFQNGVTKQCFLNLPEYVHDYGIMYDKSSNSLYLDVKKTDGSNNKVIYKQSLNDESSYYEGITYNPATLYLDYVDADIINSGYLEPSLMVSDGSGGFLIYNNGFSVSSGQGGHQGPPSFLKLNQYGVTTKIYETNNIVRCAFMTDKYIYKCLGNGIYRLPLGSYTVNPDLPSGLSLNAQSGAILGTPLYASSTQNYNVVFTYEGGSSTTDIDIEIKPSVFPYSYIYKCDNSDVISNITQSQCPECRFYNLEGDPEALSPTTVLLTGNNYYVSRFINGVESVRRMITPVLNPLFIQSPTAGSTLSSPNSLIIAANIPGAIKYVFGVKTNGFSKSYESTGRSFRLTDLGSDFSNYLFGTTFDVNVKAFGTGNVMLFPGASCTYTFTTPVAPVLISSHCGSSLGSFSDFITSTDIPGATAYKFKVTGGGLNVEYESAVRQFKLSDIPNIVLQPSTVYNISIAVKFNTIYSSYGPACTITTPSVTTQILSTQCGTTLSALNSYITANNVATASSYKFRVIGGGIDAEYVSTSRQFRLTDIPNVIINYGVAYQVSVAVGQGGQYHTYSPTCTVTTPAVYTQLQSSQCNATLTARDSYITANSSNVATSYKFKVLGGGIDAEYVSTSRQFRLTDIPNVIINYGETYQVSVAIGQNGLYHPYGTACSITTPALYTQVQTAQCGAVLAALNSFVTANAVSNATSYKFKVMGGGINAEYISSVRQFKLTDIPNVVINAATGYQVSVAVGQGGLYHPYGPSCTITTPAALYTQLIPQHCGSQMNTIDSYITANDVPAATSYKFKVTANGVDTEFVSTTRQFRLTDIPGFTPQYGTVYQISAAVGQGGQYYPYGSTCTITTPYLYTRLISSHCGSTLSSISSYITADAIATATNYKFKVLGSGVNAEYISPVRQFRLTDIPNVTISFNTVYQVSVAVEINGLYHPYGEVCTITTPQGTQIITAQCGITQPLLSSYITANAVSNATTYKFRIIGGGIDTVFASPVRQFRLTDIPNVAISFGVTYQISVAVVVNGIEYPYGNSCNITTPSPIYTQVQSSQCGQILQDNTTLIAADPVNAATEYKFKIDGGGISTEYISAIPQFRLTDIPNVVITPGSVYTISVAVKVNAEYHPWGAQCTVTAPFVATQIVADQCGVTLNTIDQSIFADNNAFATSYKFTVTGDNFSADFVTSQPQFKLTDITQAAVAFGQTYQVKVALLIDGTYHPYGSSCNISTPQPLFSEILNCGGQLNGWILHSSSVDNATSYKYLITGNGINYEYISYETLYPQFNLASLDVLFDYNTTYSVSVAVGINGFYNPYGSICEFTTIPYELSTVSPYHCGTTFQAINSYLSIEAIYRGESYRLKFIEVETNEELIVESASSNVLLSEVSNIDFGKTYKVSVAGRYNGEYFPYGDDCFITTPVVPVTNIAPEHCGTVRKFNDVIACDDTFAATSFKFKIESQDGQIAELTVNNAYMIYLASIQDFTLEYGASYYVSVAPGFWGFYAPFGPACTINTPPIIEYHLNEEFCNATIYDKNTILQAVSVNTSYNDTVNKYKFSVTDQNGVNVEYASPWPSFRLSDLPIDFVQYGQTYQIRVAAGFGRDGNVTNVSPSDIYMPFGESCNITLSALYTNLIDNQCNTVLGSLLIDDKIYFNPVPDAVQYKVKIIGDNYNGEFITNSPNIGISMLQYSSTYEVSVAVLKSFLIEFYPYGPTCTITTPPLYCSVAQCGTYLNEISSDISVGPILGTPLQNITSYKYKIVKGETEVVYISSSNTFKLTDVPGLSVNIGEVFHVSVAVQANGVYHPFSVPCDVMTPAIVSTQVQASQCNSTLVNNSTYIYADPVTGAASYRWKVVGGNINTEYVSQGSYFRLTDISSNIGAGVTFQIRVAPWKNGQYHPYGNICSVTTPVIYTQFTASQCGSTLANDSTTITVNNIGATNYIFKINGPNGIIEYNTTTPFFKLTNTGISVVPGYTYDLQVAVKIGTVIHPFGASCSVTTPYITTNVSQSHCAGTLTALNSQISASNNLVGGTYKFKVVGNGLNAEYETSVNKFRLTDLPGSSIGYSQVYQVSVALKYPGTTYYQPYGSVCNVSTPVALYSKVKASQCNGSVSSASTPIFADYVEQATNYKFKIITGGIEYFYISQYQVLSLEEVVGLPLNGGSVYTISIALEISGAYHPYGTQCNISLAGPTARVISEDANCSHIVYALNDPISFENLQDFTFYKFIIYEDNREFVYSSEEPNFKLFDFKGLNFKNLSTYDLHILTSSDGLEYKETILCNLVTNLKGSAKLDDSLVSSGLSVLVSSNPFSYECDLFLKTAMNSPIEVQVFDSVGKLVDKYIFKESTSFKLGSLWSAGIYNVIVTQGSEIKTVRLVKAGL